MKHLKVGVCLFDEEDNLITKRIGEDWTINPEYDLKRGVDSLILDELAAIMTEALKINLTKDKVREMLDEVKSYLEKKDKEPGPDPELFEQGILDHMGEF